MSQSVKLTNDNLLDSGSIVTHLFKTSGTYTTAKWTAPSSYPTLTLPYKGLYIVIVSWASPSDSYYLPAYTSLYLRTASGSASIFAGAPFYFNFSGLSTFRRAQTIHIVDVKEENTGVYGYIHTGEVDVNINEEVTAVYLGKSY